MARHSHWHNIQLKKGKADARRAKTFAKLAKNITVAAREGGGDPAFNFKLRVAVDAAKTISVPKDNIDRAIARGLGEGGEVALEEVVYEGFGPGGVAFLVACVTDNRNRTVADVKMVASKNGGTIGVAGSVMWMFEKKGVLTFLDPATIPDRDAIELALIEAGADDFLPVGTDGVQATCDIKDLKRLAEAAEQGNWKPDGTGIEYVAKTTVAVEDPTVRAELEKLVEALEQNDDVDAVYTNDL